ncbi:hypothetical protein BOX15_Mlig027292g2 [Macrostomum lignano]|uniref:CR-type domain-containing protein n=1 Tax=Macrostomum lignano TaxID=282301 RepID=A0A267DED1_9PLAT|nr:hypothetical protein BOX15_Mlig027292g2 [Macrostomum lignano]
MPSKSKVGFVNSDSGSGRGGNNGGIDRNNSRNSEDDSEDERLLAEQRASADKQLQEMDGLDGYEKIGVPGALAQLPAPKAKRQEFDAKAGAKTFEKLPKVTEEIARQTLIEHSPKKCCNGQGHLRTMPITKVENTLAWHYSLESFVESRFTCWSYEPYTGQQFDGRENGRAPGPWDIELHPKEMFADEDREITVPHSASVKPCHHCSQSGRVPCRKCRGKKTVSCSGCSGQGKKMQTQGAVPRKVVCGDCDGHGKKRCPVCQGNGDEQCSTCKGQKRLVITVKMKCEWRRKDVDFIEEKTDMPDELVRNVTGKVIFEEEAESVSPITNFPYRAVNEASRKLISAHDKNFSGQRVIRQRHQLRGVPVTECHYEHDSRLGAFFVYGFENMLYIENPPSGGCSLL